MKKLLIYLGAIFMYSNMYAQIEVHDNGKVTIGGNVPGRPSTTTFINGANGGAANSLIIRHNNAIPNTQAVSSELANPDNVSYEIHVQSNPGTFYVNGYGHIFYSGGWLMSDTATKKNIKQISNSLERLKLLNGYTFNKKSFLINKGKDSGKLFVADTFLHEGLMADQVEKIAPYMVMEMANGKKAVDYIQLIPLLIESIKELDIENKTMYQEHELLKARFNKLGENLDTSGGNFKLNSQIPSSNYFLYQNSPNPFNSETQINFALNSTYNSAHIYVFDLMGTLKKSYKLSSTNGYITIKSNELSAGMYLYSLIVDGKEIDTKRMLLTN